MLKEKKVVLRTLMVHRRTGFQIIACLDLNREPPILQHFTLETHYRGPRAGQFDCSRVIVAGAKKSSGGSCAPWFKRAGQRRSVVPTAMVKF
jgi:hypothetical protein